MRRFALLACASLTACARPSGAPPVAIEIAPPTPSPAPWPGAAHEHDLTQVALAPDGTAALSRDAAGSVRLWNDLDGSRPPVPLPALLAPNEAAVLDVIADEGGWRALMLVGDSATGSARRTPGRHGSPGGALPLRPLMGADGLSAGLALDDGAVVRVLRESGLTTAALDDVAAGRLGTAVPLSRDAREVFDVSWGRAGERIVDWGDAWEVSGEASARWDRDVPVFGVLSPSPAGNGLLTLPECNDADPRLAIHPRPAARLQPEDTLTIALSITDDVQWSPDGGRLAIAGGERGGLLYDLESREFTRRWTGASFTRHDAPPLQPGPALGRCEDAENFFYEGE